MKGFWTWRWLGTTALVLLGTVLLAALGFWQLDRLAQRRATNARVLAARQAPALDLNEPLPAGDSLPEMEYRAARGQGEFLEEKSILLRNQVWVDADGNSLAGYHLLTPLRLAGSETVVLVDRGWIALEDAGSTYPAPEGVVSGVLLRPRAQGQPATPGQTAWTTVDLDQMQTQLGLPLLPVYLLAEPNGTRKPYGTTFDVELSEGSHLSYAIQWFLFAAILLGGYPFFVRRQLKAETTQQNKTPAAVEYPATVKG